MKLFLSLLTVALVAFGFYSQVDPTIIASAPEAISSTIDLPHVATPILSGLAVQVWLAEIKEGFFADDMWLSECRDLSPFVEADIINLAEAGADPTVLINNTTYPIPVVERTDGNYAMELDRFDTENTAVKHADLVELSYDKLESVTRRHKVALRMAFMEKGAHAIAPDSDTAATPVIVTTGADHGDGYKAMQFKDIRTLKRKFDDAEVPSEGRVLILTARHAEDLDNEDADRYDRLLKNGMIYGFKVYYQAEKRMPHYDTVGGTKNPFGAVPAGTDQYASIAFHKDEVGRAVGTDEMYHQEALKDPQNRQDTIGFSRRGLVIPLVGRAVAAIYAPAV